MFTTHRKVNHRTERLRVTPVVAAGELERSEPWGRMIGLVFSWEEAELKGTVDLLISSSVAILDRWAFVEGSMLLGGVSNGLASQLLTSRNWRPLRRVNESNPADSLSSKLQRNPAGSLFHTCCMPSLINFESIFERTSFGVPRADGFCFVLLRPLFRKAPPWKPPNNCKKFRKIWFSCTQRGKFKFSRCPEKWKKLIQRK